MYCNYCGKVIQDDAQHCAYCGKHVAGVVARQRLVRPRYGRKIAGVCLGFSEYFNLDVTLIRIVWAVCAICQPVIGWRCRKPSSAAAVAFTFAT